LFVAGYGAALVSGIGDVIDPLPAPRPPAGLLLVTAAQRLSTAAVFAELDRGRPADRTSSHIPGASEAAADVLAQALRAGLDGAALLVLATRLRDANDLWPAASRLSPTLAATRDALEQALGRPVLLSGSGPTLVAVYPSHEFAAAAAVRLQKDRPAVLHDAIIAVTSSSNGGSS
jgi:4-diphosphocytidyl-2-C-methyl-D-erythritol kinase